MDDDTRKAEELAAAVQKQAEDKVQQLTKQTEREMASLQARLKQDTDKMLAQAAEDAERTRREFLEAAERERELKEEEARMRAAEEAARQQEEERRRREAEELAARREQAMQDARDRGEAEAQLSLSGAAREADELRKDAKLRAEQILSKAQQQADDVLSKAEAQAAELAASAAARAATIRAEAETEAARVADAIDEEAQHAEVAGGLAESLLTPQKSKMGDFREVPGSKSSTTPKPKNRHEAVTAYFGALWDEMPQQWFGKDEVGTKQHAIKDALQNPQDYKPHTAQILVKLFYGQRWQNLSIDAKQNAVKLSLLRPEAFGRGAMAPTVQKIKEIISSSDVYAKHNAKYACVRFDQSGGAQSQKSALQSNVPSRLCAACGAEECRLVDFDQRHRQGILAAESWDVVCEECGTLTSCAWLKECAAAMVGVHKPDNYYDSQWDAVLAATLKSPLRHMP